MSVLRAVGRALLDRATHHRAIRRLLAADAFYPFWIQGLRLPTAEDIAAAEENAKQALEIAHEENDDELASLALDAMSGAATSLNDYPRARELAVQRIAFEDRLGLYERLDAHSTVAWMSYLMGDLETADRDSAAMVARLMPGRAPSPVLHHYASAPPALTSL